MFEEFFYVHMSLLHKPSLLALTSKQVMEPKGTQVWNIQLSAHYEQKSRAVELPTALHSSLS